MIKAIETVYNGYRFRSRLEARWAVYFDTLGIRWEYEKEGYDLDGTYYLPDFWLPEPGRWIEIKANPPTEAELAKVSKLHDLTGYPACLFYGLPGEYGGDAYFSNSNDSGGGHTSTFDIGWWECRKCGAIDVYIRWWHDEIIVNEEEGWRNINACHCDPTIIDGGNVPTPRLTAAYTAARQARFEHGESGTSKR